jgi:hypothetical protein
MFPCEPPTDNPCAEWVQTEKESYRSEAAKRLTANSPVYDGDLRPKVRPGMEKVWASGRLAAEPSPAHDNREFPSSCLSSSRWGVNVAVFATRTDKRVQCGRFPSDWWAQFHGLAGQKTIWRPGGLSHWGIDTWFRLRQPRQPEPADAHADTGSTHGIDNQAVKPR